MNTRTTSGSAGSGRSGEDRPHAPRAAGRHGLGGRRAVGPGARRSVDPAAEEAVDDRLGRVGSGEQVALAELATELLEHGQLALVLDALGDHPGAERVAGGDHRPGEGPDVGAAVGPADELAGDLDDVDLEPAEIAQRRVAGPEVVDRDPDAERPERLEPGD